MLKPLSLIILIFVAAWLAKRMGYRKVASCGAMAAVVLLYLLSIYPVANSLAAPLESSYQAYSDQLVDAVIVLGGGHRSDARVPITSLLSPASMVRLSEGVRVYRANPGAKLYLSGYGGQDPMSQAEAMSKVALAMGVPNGDIVIDAQPRDTQDEAAAWSAMLEDKRVALVTSAMHLPRGMFWFEHYGVKPVPAPTNFRAGAIKLGSLYSWLPQANALAIVESAWHEYLGLWWAQIRVSMGSSEA